MISKSHVESILNQKQGELDDDNSEQSKAWRARRKKLVEELEKAEKALGVAVDKFSATPSVKNQELELKSTADKLDRQMKRAVESKFKPSEQKIHADFLAAGKRMFDITQEIDQLSVDQKEGKVTFEEYAQKVPKLREEKKELEAKRELADEALDKLYEKYGRASQDLRALYKELRAARKKYYATQNAEYARNRLIPDAEQRIAQINQAREKLEEEVKSKRRAIKRAGPPITPEDYARSVLSVINERTHNHYDLVSNKAAPNPRISSNAQDILFFWIMPVTKLSALSRLTGGKNKVLQWDFPFDRERHESDDESTSSDAKGWVHLKDRDPTSLSREDLLEFLEYPQNAKYRPEGWTSRYKAVRRPKD
jgi:chromosome segregation ATPase